LLRLNARWPKCVLCGQNLKITIRWTFSFFTFQKKFTFQIGLFNIFIHSDTDELQTIKFSWVCTWRELSADERDAGLWAKGHSRDWLLASDSKFRPETLNKVEWFSLPTNIILLAKPILIPKQELYAYFKGNTFTIDKREKVPYFEKKI
jgi:hypothetical protein